MTTTRVSPHFFQLLYILLEMKGRGDETVSNIWTNHGFRYGIIMLCISFFTLFIAFHKILYVFFDHY